MCLKPILKIDKQKYNFERYELVRQAGLYNMLDTKARELTGLTIEEYNYVIKNYTEFLNRYPDTREKIRKLLQNRRITEENKNCIKELMKKLDVQRFESRIV